MQNRIGSERVRIRMTQKELAKQLGVSTQAVSQWETGKSDCPAKRLVALSRIFGCTTDWLLGLTDERL